MGEGTDMTGSSNSSPREALERAEAALRRLEQSQTAEQRVGAVTRMTAWAVVVLAVIGLVVHTFFEDASPQVDSTSVALLAVALIAPFVSRLKALELGGAKAEWQEGAAIGLKEIIQVLGTQQTAVAQLFDEITARATAGPDVGPSTAKPEAAPEISKSMPGPLCTLLWVDDHPENNTYELESLRQILDVLTVTTNEDAFTVLAEQEIDAVISDVGRDDDRPGDLPGGVLLIQDLRQRFPERQMPLLYYTSGRSIQRYGRDLEAGGALIVTSLFSDLLRALRQIEEQNLETIARAVAGEKGTLRERTDGNEPDLIVQLASGHIIGIGIASWLQRPQMAAFVERADPLVQAVRRGDIARGLRTFFRRREARETAVSASGQTTARDLIPS